MLRTSSLQIVALVLVIALCAPLTSAFTPTEECTAPSDYEAHRITGEIAGTHAYDANFGPGWRFALVPETGGWRIEIRDAAGLDLSQMTPPLHGPNPRQLHGWHFRNQANTGPNEGDVNAPQRTRTFGFDPRLSGTAGWRPPRDSHGVPDQPGRGTLTILDLELADLAPGQRARMVALRFSACLTWPSAFGSSPSATATPVVVPAIEARMRRCGLGPDFQLGAFLQPTSHRGDFDGDGQLDLVTPVVRTRDGKRALAVCRRGSQLDVLGLSGMLGEHLGPEYFDHVDWWTYQEQGTVFQGAQEGPPPVLVGAAITIGKEDSSSVLIYWDGTAWTSYWQGD